MIPLGVKISTHQALYSLEGFIAITMVANAERLSARNGDPAILDL
jgi:hypothetical protein